MNPPSPPIISELPSPSPTQTPAGLTAPNQPQIPSGQLVECVWLDWHDRRKVRQRVCSDAGTELCLSLPRGTVLVDGQALLLESNRHIIVRAKSEPLLAISPSTLQDACRVAHHLGNWHRPIQIDPDGKLWVAKDRPIVEWLERSHIPFEELDSPFEPNSIANSHHH
ncbi:MAG: urease accessory protein UreE [Synechococcus sp.]